MVIAESNANDPKTIRPEADGGRGCDAQWADDFHHSLRTLLTGEHEGYYADFGRVADLAKAFDRPFVYAGDYSRARERRVGAPAGDRAPWQFVVCSQNHDQVGNRALGDRMPPPARPLAALCVLLSPFTPMLFMGEEYGEPQPFQFFTDHIEKKIAEATRKGRRKEFEAFVDFAAEVPDPQDPATFERSKLSRREDPADRGALPPALRAARRAARQRGRRGRVRRGGALALAAARRRSRSSATSPPASSRSPAPPPRSSSPPTARTGWRPTARRCCCPRSAGRCCGERGRRGAAAGHPPRQAVPARRHLGRQGDELLALLRPRRAGLPLPLRRGGQRDAGRAAARRSPQLARLPARDRPGAALRVPRPRALRAGRPGTASTPASCCSTPTRRRSTGRSTGIAPTSSPTSPMAPRTPTWKPTTKTIATRCRARWSPIRPSTGRGSRRRTRAGPTPSSTRPTSKASR